MLASSHILFLRGRSSIDALQALGTPLDQSHIMNILKRSNNFASFGVHADETADTIAYRPLPLRLALRLELIPVCLKTVVNALPTR